MHTTARERVIKLSQAGLLERFERSLPKFSDMDAEGYSKFVKALDLLASKYHVSSEQLRNSRLENYRPHIERLKALHEEYANRDKLIASAILTIELHIESFYRNGRDAELVHTLTGLHICS